MEVTLLFPNSIRIKGKSMSLVVNPVLQMKKVSADAVLLLSDMDEEQNSQKVEDFRVIIKGPGEYEIGGVRVLATRIADKFIYSIDIDNLEVCLGKGSAMDKASEAKDCDVLIIETDSSINSSIITSFEPKVVILYGEKAKEQAQVLGKSNITTGSKFSVSGDKLAEEMEVVVLE